MKSKYRIKNNKQLEKFEKMGNAIVVFWVDSAPMVAWWTGNSWRDKFDRGYDLDAPYHEIYKTE